MTTVIHDLERISDERIHNVELVPISDALRMHFGRIKVKGMICSLTKLFKMISGIKFYCDRCMKPNEIDFPFPISNIGKNEAKCRYCNKNIENVNYDYVNTVVVELQDLESFNDLERLPVFLFDGDTENIHVGETVIIEGQIRINESKNSGKKLFPYFYAKSIQYDRSDSTALTQTDIDAINRFTKKHNSKIIDTLVLMFDPSIIGYEYVKKGLLLCAVNSSCDGNTRNSTNLRRERIHAFLIGESGLAKSRLLKSVTKLVPNSKYESGGHNSSGKSLTAIVSKEEENYLLRLGPAPLSKNAICAVNEFGRMYYDDQTHFLDIMEEGEFTITKHGINATIKSPTTIIASANPINNSAWASEDKIDINEIPALKPIIDRFDLIFVFRNLKDEKVVREYAYKRSELETRKIPDYSNYIIKHIEYAKRFNPKISDEAKIMLNEFFIKIRTQHFGSNRILDTLFRLSKSIARLKLKQIVDEEDANEAMEFYNIVLQNFQSVISVSTSPKVIAYNTCIMILKELNSSITFEDLVIKICEKNEQVRLYLNFENKSLKIHKNRKVRGLYDMLVNHANIKRTNEKPTVLQWIEKNENGIPYDVYDSYDRI